MTIHSRIVGQSKQRSLTTHLLRGVIAPTVAVILILLMVILMGTYLILRDIVNYQTLLINALARQGDQYLDETERLMQTLVAMLPHLEPDAYTQLLAETRGPYSRFTAFYVLDARGVVLAEDTEALTLLGLDLSGETFFRRARDSGEIYYSEPFISLATEKVSVTGAAPIFNGDSFQGVLVGELNLEILQDVINQLDTGPETIAYIVDRRGTLIAHPSPEWVQQRRNLGDVPLVKHGLTDGDTFEFYRDPQVATWVMGSVTRMGQNWLVVTTQPATVAARPLIRLSLISAGAMGVSIYLFLWFQVRTFRQITRPIALLAEDADALAHARERQPLAPDTFGHFQELVSLGQSFTQMAQAVEERTAQLLTANRALEKELQERRRAENDLAHVQHLLQSITDSMPSALITLDPEGRVIMWNPAASQIIGQQPLSGEVLWEHCPGLARYRPLFEQVIREGAMLHQHRESWEQIRPGTYHDVTLFPLQAEAPSPAGALQGVVLRIDDVTRRVQMEEMMLQSAKMASLGGLAAGVAHEINNPLAVMMQSAQVIQIALDVDRATTQERLRAQGVDVAAIKRYLAARGVAEYLTGIRETGARAAKIVADLLSFSRQRAFQAMPHDLNALVIQTLALASTDYDLKKKYDFREIQIQARLADELPQVLCDGQQIQQVILNLLRNAAQAMSDERKRRGATYQPQLWLETTAHARGVRLAVIDNGPGLPESKQAQLFDPFFTTKDVGAGTGLGLWLCWSIVVERHHGQIWAQNRAEGGAHFEVELPIAAEDR